MTARDLETRQLVPVVPVLLNGVSCELIGDPSRRLSSALRDELGLTGTKIGCHAGDCGACTLLVGDEQRCACLTSVGQCGGAAITTVEGLAATPEGERLQRAFIAHGAAQCGICTPGMLMAAASLLRTDAAPDEAAVRDALAGVLCRCTGYTKIVEAVLAASRGAVALPEAPARGAAVGARAARLDGPAKVSGRERFGADVPPAAASAMLGLRIVRSPHPHARFALGDVAAFTRAHPGVAAVLTAGDVPHNAYAIFPDLRDQPVLADGVARFRGDAVLGLVGDAEAIAAIPECDLPLVWTVLEPALDPESALAAAARGDPLHARFPDNVLCRGRVVRGDVERALADGSQAVHVARAAFRTHHVEHAYIEPEAGYAEPVAGAGGEVRVRIVACTQTPYMDRDEVAHVLGVEPTRVHIVPSGIGGGFGGKLDLFAQPLLAIAALKLGRAVRCVYERPESMLATTKRHPAWMKGVAACDADGRLVACDFQGDFDTGAYSSWGPTVANRVPIHASGPYRVPHVRALTRAVFTNGPVCGAFRGFGVPQSTLLGEALLDELAARSGLDPLEFRWRNALVAGDATPTGQVLAASVGLRACLDALRPAWVAARAAAEAFNTGAEGARAAIRRGVGIACMWYGIGNTVIANPSTIRGSLRWSAERGAHLYLCNGAQEIGQGTATIVPQMFADAVGLPLACVEQVMGDTDLTPDAGKSSASRQTFVSGNAARLAGEALRRKLLAAVTPGLAQHRQDRQDRDAADPQTLQLSLTRDHLILTTADGHAHALDLRTLPRTAAGDVFDATGHFNPPTVPLDADGQGVPYATWAFAAQFAELEVDLDLGTVRILHLHAAHDVGRAINPTLVEGQIHGGIAQGIGLALMEEYDSGRTDNLHDYLIPTVGDVPPITVHLVEDPEPLGPWGAKGVGEPALVATAPAILAAIRMATGATLAEVPVTPARLRAAIVAAASDRA